MMRIKKAHLLIAAVGLGVCAVAFRAKLQRPAAALYQVLRGKRTVAERVDEFGTAVRARLAPDFERAGVSYPPRAAVLLGLKDEMRLEVWVSDGGPSFEMLRSYPILAGSGTLGPKLREGDRQVPEGLYRVESLNPNSVFHLSLRLDYPNEFDAARGGLDGRGDLGGDIMIHGKSRSIGCLAMGDEAAEDLFVLAAETGVGNVSVILSPVDFRVRELPSDMPYVPQWTAGLYDEIERELEKLGGPER